MDVVIEDMENVVRVSDEQSLVAPEVLEKIVQAVVARLRETQGAQRRAEQDRTLSSSVTGETR